MSPQFFYIGAFVLAFIGCCALLMLLIPRLRAMHMGQTILEIGPIWHAKKEGTPTMGGLAFILISLLIALLLAPIAVRSIPQSELYPFYITLLFCAANGAIGMVDDLTKLRHHRNEGLTPTQKLILQITFAAAYLALLRLCDLLDEALRLSLLGNLPFGFATYFVLMILILGIVNCANLTDGIDGLASAVAAIIFAAYTLLSARADAFAPTVLSIMLLGCSLAFFLFNHHPARIFMGDTGSLFLGAGAVSIALLLGNHLLPLICGIIYVIEGASVILQVIYYKATHKRLFLMAPIHHHFEKCGWSENKIVAVFSAVTALACVLAAWLP